MSELDQVGFQQLMSPLLQEADIKHIAVACSGGPDSMALSHLLKDYCEKQGIKLTALIVDHELRDESADEASLVNDRLSALGVHAIILKDQQSSIQNNIQSQARNLRYGLMLDWCETNAVQHLCLAHHKDDQAETFLLRLARGSGPAGLSAMKPIEQRGDITLLRPFLSKTKQSLLKYLQENQLEWVEDPSNQLDKFDRVKIRKLAPALSEVGLDASRLAKTAQVMTDSQEALDWALAEALKAHMKIYDLGCYSISKTRLLELPKALALRALSLMISSAAGQVYPPELSMLEQVYDHLNEEGYGATCHGAQLHSRGDVLWVGRELSRIMVVDTKLWDGRFVISGLSEGYSIRPLGEMGWKKWCLMQDKTKKDCFYPAYIRNGLPSLYFKGEFVVPLYSLFEGDNVENHEIRQNIKIHFNIPPQFNDFTFSTALSDTM